MDNMDKERFLRLMSLIESSGGINLNHQPVTQGIHAGTRAQGQYGLMPNTVRDIARNARDLPENIRSLEKADTNAIVNALKDQNVEQMLAEKLADRVLSKYPNDEQAAQAWQYGHYRKPEDYNDDVLNSSDRIQKYRKFKTLENMRMPAAIGTPKVTKDRKDG